MPTNHTILDPCCCIDPPIDGNSRPGGVFGPGSWDRYFRGKMRTTTLIKALKLGFDCGFSVLTDTYPLVKIFLLVFMGLLMEDDYPKDMLYNTIHQQYLWDNL